MHAGEALRRPRSRAQSQSGNASHSFLLDDDSANPFAAADVANAMDDRSLYLALTIPAQLQGNRSFEFLRRELRPPTSSGGGAPGGQ